jgi:hypothetical protein
MMKSVGNNGISIKPDFFGSLEKAMGADYIRLQKGIRAGNRSVDVRLGGQMNNGVNAAFTKEFFNQFPITDIPMNEGVIRVIFYRIETG